MHLVFVTSLVPVAAPSSGYDIANRVIVDALLRAGHRVSVLGYLQPGDELAYPGSTGLLGELAVTNARVGTGQKLAWLAAAMARDEPVSVAKMHAVSPDHVRRSLQAFAPFEALVLNSVQLPGAFFEIFRQWPSLFVAHNVEARSAADNAANAASPIWRHLFRRDARLLKRIEAKLCDHAAFVFTLADGDRAALGVDRDGRSATLPLVTRMAPPPAPKPRELRYDIGLIGSWTWAANRAGLDWFLTDIVPRLPTDFSIAVAGGIDAVPAGVPANVEFLGRVPGARDFVRSLRVVSLVSRTGTGVQLKTIETFEMGLPAVATGNALRGISGIPENCRAAESAGDFAAGLVELVGRSRAGGALDVDGRHFHARQLAGLERAIGEGIAGLKGSTRAAVGGPSWLTDGKRVS